MLLLSLLLCQNAALQRGPCDLPFVWVHVRVEEACSCNGLWSLIAESPWLQWHVAAGCGKPVAALGATYGLRERPLPPKSAKQAKCRQLPPQHRKALGLSCNQEPRIHIARVFS